MAWMENLTGWRLLAFWCVVMVIDVALCVSIVFGLTTWFPK